MGNHLAEITDYLWRQSWQLAVLIVVVAGICSILRNKSAHVRYLLWLIVLAKCVVPPFLTVPLAVLPAEQSTESLARLPVARPLVVPEVPEEGSSLSMVKPSLSVERDTPQAKTSRFSTPSGRQVFGAVWILGVAIFGCVAIAKAMRSNLRLRRQRSPLPGDLQISVGELLQSFGVKRHPQVWLLNGVGQPFVWGLLRGNIYLPSDYLKIDNAAHRRNILGHEVCHILRLDAAVNSLQVLAQTIFWFHPLVWWANQKIRMEREKCCDEMAVAHLGTKAKEYSTAIVKALITEHESTRPVPSLAVAGPVKDVEERIRTMLRPGKKFYRCPNSVTITVVLVLAFLTVPTALVLTVKAQEKTAAEPSTALTEEDKAAATAALFRAIEISNIAHVKSAVARGADIEAKDERGYTPLHAAVRRSGGKMKIIKFLLEAGVNPNARDPEGQIPLHRSARDWQTAEVRILLSGGSDVNVTDKQGRTPAMISFGNGRTEMFDLMVAHGANVPADFMAAYEGNTSEVQNIIEKGNAQETFEQGLTLLHAAAAGGHALIVELLLTNELDIHSKTQEGYTALHYAAANNHREVAKLLLAKGADINAGTWRTPLHWAVREGRKEMVAWLLSRGADPNSAKNGRPPLLWAVWIWDTDIAELIMSYGGDIHLQTEDYPWSPLYDAVWDGDPNMAKTLVTKAQDAEAAQWAPFHAAVAGWDKETAEDLLASGIDVNVKGDRSYSALHIAAAKGAKNIAEMLIEEGANVNARAGNDRWEGVWDEGWTPLQLSCMKGEIAVVELLLDKGAEVDVKTKGGSTALSLAKDRGYTEIVELLKKHGAKE